MTNEAMKEVLNELFSHLERLETQNEAILQFLKEKKRVTDKQLAPYLEQAANASNVKWRAARVRIDHLLSPEQPEKEAKLGKTPELHEDLSSANSSEEKRSGSDVKDDKQVGAVNEESKKTVDHKKIEARDKDAKKTESASAGDDLNKTEKPVPVETAHARSTEGQEDKAEEASEKPRNIEQTMHEQREPKSDSDDFHHVTEATEPSAEQQNGEPAAQLKPDKTQGGKEAA